MLIDSNLIIYAAQPANSKLRDFIANNAPAVSAVSYVEVLGFHRLAQDDRLAFELFFASAEILHITQQVLDQAVALRQQRRMSLGDALVAATALVHRRTLLTRNVDDFSWVSGLQVIDPLA
jgi:predicted nucleic acid-binding protein